MRFTAFDEIEDLCRNKVPEALQLEFKEKAAPERAQLDNGDKKNIAKAVSAFANSGGGTLLIGVRTARAGEVDVADELRPITDPDHCRVQVEYVCKTNVSPEIQGLEVLAFTGPDGLGVIACVIPASDRRPHMSTAPGVHAYFRRTFQGNVPMTPFEVQEQILAVREAVIKPTVRVGRGASITRMPHWISLDYGVNFGVENIGTRACINPYLRAGCSEIARSSSSYFDARLEMWKVNTNVGTLIHVDDAHHFFVLQFTARVFPEELAAASQLGEEELLKAVHLYGGENQPNSPTVTDKTEIEGLSFELKYGAENAASRTAHVVLDRREIAARLLIANEEQIIERSRDYVGVWRSDLVAALRTQYPGFVN